MRNYKTLDVFFAVPEEMMSIDLGSLCATLLSPQVLISSVHVERSYGAAKCRIALCFCFEGWSETAVVSKSKHITTILKVDPFLEAPEWVMKIPEVRDAVRSLPQESAAP